jgi:hypothetical protein
MKKINIKLVSLALFVLTLLVGGLTAKQVIAGGNGGVAPDFDPDGG